MSIEQRNRHFPQILGCSLLLGCATAALWLATAVVVPSAQSYLQPHGAQNLGYYAPAFHIQRFCYHLITPIAVAGSLLMVVTLLGRGPARLVTTLRMALAVLSGLIACLSLYLLSAGGIAYKLVSGDQMLKTRFYERTLDQFALLEAAQGRYDKFSEALIKTRDMKMLEARNVSEFTDAEARERVSIIISSISKATDTAMKRKMLATLCLFRERIPKDSYEARNIPRQATEAGAPSTNSHIETLEWIAATLNKDGWEPLPLFKLSQSKP